MVIPRRTAPVWVEGQEYAIQELSAREAFQIWDDLSKAEQTGNRLGVYLDLVALGLRRSDGTVIFTESNRDELGEWPSRIVIPLAEQILGLSEVGLESGEADGGQGSGSDTVSRSPLVAQMPTRS